jgi:histidinol-phosphate aminotransferase
MAFAGSGHKLMTAVPTFEAIAHYSSSMGGQVVTFPLTANYAHDLAAMAARADSTTGLVYICNPNNPTGSLTPRREIEALLHKLPASTYVLVDEAYHHFVDSPEYVSFLDKPVNDPRVIVARTFSKVYGMAGIRAGYSISTVETAATLRRYQNADNLNVLAAHAAAVGLGDAEGTQQAVVRNARDRAEFMQQAGRRGLKSIPSQANFVMMDARRPAPGVIQDFRQRGILIGRPFPPMDNFVRISLGTPEQMTAFWRAWDQLPKVN